MCELAAKEVSTNFNVIPRYVLTSIQTSDWLSCDPWEATASEYVPTAEVLDRTFITEATTLE